MDIKVQTPQAFSNLNDIYSYLFQMAQTINACNDAIQQQTDSQVAKALVKAGTASSDEAGKAAQNLRALIINTADSINAVMAENTRVLNQKIEVNSQKFGSITSTVSQAITESADGMLQRFSSSEVIQGINNQLQGLSSYQTRTEGYIRSGFIETKPDGTPILGIAIAQQISSTQEIIGDTTYERFPAEMPCAFYTATKVSFRLNGREVAYFSNDALHCGNLEAEGTVTLGGNWQISSGHDLTIRWVGV